MKASTDGSTGGLNKVVSQKRFRHYCICSRPKPCRQSFATVCSPTVRVLLSSAVPETRYTQITIGSCVSGTPSYPQSTPATIRNTIKGSQPSSKRNLFTEGGVAVVRLLCKLECYYLKTRYELWGRTRINITA